MIYNPLLDSPLLSSTFVVIALSLITIPATLYFISIISGWKNLAKKYPPLHNPLPTKQWGWKSAGIGIVNFNNCINLKISEQGLHLKMVKVFNWGIFKNIVIPWKDLTSVEIDKYTKLTPKQQPQTKIKIKTKIFKELKKEAQKYKTSSPKTNAF